GEYDAAHQLFIDNKVHAGRPGFHVVAPLRLAASSRYVLVDRGWIAQGARRSDLPVVPPPEGNVPVIGRVTLPPQHYVELPRQRAADTGAAGAGLRRAGHRFVHGVLLAAPSGACQLRRARGQARARNRRRRRRWRTLATVVIARTLDSSDPRGHRLRRTLRACALCNPPGAHDPESRA